MLETVVVVAGTLLLVGGISRWWQQRVRARELLASALASPDRALRMAAVRTIAEVGLTRWARVLSGLTEQEQDPEVLDLLAALVIRNQWEPASTAELVELRLWAHRRLEQPSISPPAVQTLVPEGSSGRRRDVRAVNLAYLPPTAEQGRS